MFRKFARPTPRLAVHVLVVGTVLILACGWVGGSTPTPTPAAVTAVASPASGTPSGPLTPPSPSPAPPSPSPSPSPSPAAGETYTVAEGDTLATIAERFYGDPSAWRRIYDANRSLIGENPDSVKIGMQLRIPPRP
ncbi:MAG: LysM peptidoglycan-binding domain-containing protein [Chloroflexi bacterium]|nr:LysM peptidoglycan-binding domain-containing protein [Chloroflexota bacterium]